jgi:hypothetical protein
VKKEERRRKRGERRKKRQACVSQLRAWSKGQGIEEKGRLLPVVVGTIKGCVSHNAMLWEKTMTGEGYFGRAKTRQQVPLDNGTTGRQKQDRRTTRPRDNKTKGESEWRGSRVQTGNGVSRGLSFPN